MPCAKAPRIFCSSLSTRGTWRRASRLALVDKALEKRELKAVVAIHEASKAMFRTIKLDVLLPLITKLTRAVLRADQVSVALIEEGRPPEEAVPLEPAICAQPPDAKSA